MEQTKAKSKNRKKALRIVFAVGILLTAMILLLSRGKGDGVSTLEGRQIFLGELGWEVDPTSEDMRIVQLPEVLEGMLKDYNEIQLKQGYDLSKHLGETCQQYCYRVTNYPDQSQTVLVTLYIQGDRVIAGDVHSTALKGFLQGLKQE